MILLKLLSDKLAHDDFCCQFPASLHKQICLHRSFSSLSRSPNFSYGLLHTWPLNYKEYFTDILFNSSRSTHTQAFTILSSLYNRHLQTMKTSLFGFGEQKRNRTKYLPFILPSKIQERILSWTGVLCGKDGRTPNIICLASLGPQLRYVVSPLSCPGQRWKRNAKTPCRGVPTLWLESQALSLSLGAGLRTFIMMQWWLITDPFLLILCHEICMGASLLVPCFLHQRSTQTEVIA